MFERGIRLFFQALKTNWLPAIGIWAMGSLIVYGYYKGGIVLDASEHVLALREDLGLLYPVLSMMLFGAFLPSLTQILLLPSSRASVLRRLPYLLPFWAEKGLEVELFYYSQSLLFGSEPTLPVIIGKVFVDQFIYTTTWGAISTVIYLRWMARRIGDIPADTAIAPNNWYSRVVFPVIVANWALWIPAVTLVYLLPTPLQLPLANMILWLWSLMLIFISKHDG